MRRGSALVPDTTAAEGALPAAAAVLDQAGAENFPVASRVLPRRTRVHLMRLYGYARLVDDTGDELAGSRSAGLDRVAADLDAVFGGGRPEHPLMRALAGSVAELGLPEQPFRDLLAANRMDQEVARYQSFEELVGYCRLSADPVGRLVLAVFGLATPERVALSDAVCTALQLIEHWQDVAEDRSRGRVYLPAEDMAAFGVEPADLDRPAAGPALRRLVAFEAARAGEWLERGAPLVGRVPGRPRLAVAGFVGGGRAALAALARVDHEVLGHRARPTRRGTLLGALRALVRYR